MKKIETWKILVFVGGLMFLALLMNLRFRVKDEYAVKERLPNSTQAEEATTPNQIYYLQ